MIELNLLSKQEAKSISNKVKEFGYPPENKILMAIPNSGNKTSGGIIIPDNAKEDVPKKGVIVSFGDITEEYKSYQNLQIGDIVNYGLYAGKEIELPITLNDCKFHVISVNEILFIEFNHQ